MTAETLHCRCGVEVRLVRLNDQILALGHVQNPRQNHHRVRLARTKPTAQLRPQRGSTSGSAPHALTPRAAVGAGSRH